jgi:hypothetical protein
MIGFFPENGMARIPHAKIDILWSFLDFRTLGCNHMEQLRDRHPRGL